MPISGVVITCRAEATKTVLADLTHYQSLEIHGSDEQGNIVAVIDSESSETMETIIDTINQHEDVLNVGMTYLNTEDEAEQMARGEKLSKPFGFRKPLNSPSSTDTE